MPGKHLTASPAFFARSNWRREKFSKKNCPLSWLAIFCLAQSSPVFAGDTNLIAPKFLGSQSCSSSSCHGGAGEKSNQYTVWSSRDFHHQRPFATLTTARSARIAEVLKIGDPTQSARCTVCHAPLQTVPTERLGKEVKITEGVSCENCHGPAENWIRSHTRPDYTHADRVASGMRDLKNLYVRANTCVACHQNVDTDIREAGHPELIFELDGQSVTMPRHWRKSEDKPGPQIWLVGQAVALREMSWQLSNEKAANQTLLERWAGLFWVLQTVSQDRDDAPVIDPDSFSKAENVARAGQWSDKLAADAAQAVPSEVLTRQGLLLLANTNDTFADKHIPRQIQARRAERLVLALDRLSLGLDNVATNSAVNQRLNRLFADAQSLPDFDPNQFAKDLNEFNATVSGILNSR